MNKVQDNNIQTRLTRLIDKDSFVEINTKAVITGKGTVEGRPVYVFAHDASVAGGSMTESMAREICKVMDMAIAEGVPLICLNSSAGASIQEGLAALDGLGEIFSRHIAASGKIPQISGIFGPCAGGGVYSPALTNFTIMIQGSSFMYLTGPRVVKNATGEVVGHEELGGAFIHSHESGVAHFAAATEEEGIDTIKALLEYLPSNSKERAPHRPTDDPKDRKCNALKYIVPNNQSLSYDMYEVIREITDEGRYLDIHKGWARNIITCLAHMGGRSVGIIANQPKVMAGAIDGKASQKVASFIRTCSSFNIPVISLIDTPGYLCGSKQEKSGIITHGAELLRAYGKADTLKISVNLRKAYGGAYITLSSKTLGSDINMAWPQASYAVMGAESAMEILYSKESEEIKSQKIKEYKEKFCNPFKVAEKGYIDAVIRPEETRLQIIKSLEKHDDFTI